jgi:hypothetical protein
MSHEFAVDVVTPGGSDFLAMAIAFVVYFLASFLWWGPLFGKKWAALMGMDMNEKPSMTMPMILQVIGSLLLTYVLWHVMMAFSVTHGTDGLMRGDLSMANGLIGAFFTWLGFFVPVQLGRISWEKATWPLFGINAGGHLVGLLLMGLVFALM